MVVSKEFTRIIIPVVFLLFTCNNVSNTTIFGPEQKLQSSTPTIVYSVIFEWRASIYIIENGVNRSLFNADTVCRTMPSLDPSSGKVVYLRDAALFPMVGFRGWPSVSVANVATKVEKTVLMAEEGVHYLSPEWDGNGNIVVYRMKGGVLEVLVVTESGEIKGQHSLGSSSVPDYPAIYAVPEKKGFVVLWWEDTTAIFDVTAGTFHGKTAGGAIRNQPFVCGDSLFIQGGFSKPIYRVYSLSTLEPADRFYNVNITLPSSGAVVQIDSARIAWMNEKQRAIYDLGEEKCMIYLCDNSWNVLHAQQVACIDYFLPLFNEKEGYCVAEGGDQYAVIKYKLDPAGIEEGYEFLTAFEEDYFILDARIYP